MTLKISSWNVNGIRARIEEIPKWLKEYDPDILCLNETKCINEDFPSDIFEELGYNLYLNGQKSFNGVAILTKGEAKLSNRILPGDSDDKQSRFIEAYYQEKRFVCIYLPNGNPKGTEKFEYKLKWMDRLNQYCKKALMSEEEIIVLGDFNVIPQYIDCKYPDQWAQDALFDPQVRAKFNYLLNLGYIDALRILNDSDSIFTQWDYRNRAWEENNGVRIDHIM